MKKIFILLMIVSISILTCCNRAVNVTGDERTKVLEYADPAANNILSAFNENNYQQFSQDFDEKMKNNLTEKVYKQTRDTILDKIGKYKSKELDTVQKQGPYYIVFYTGEFERDKDVTIKIVFMKYVDKNLVSALWFNSQKLRQ